MSFNAELYVKNLNLLSYWYFLLIFAIKAFQKDLSCGEFFSSKTLSPENCENKGNVEYAWISIFSPLLSLSICNKTCRIYNSLGFVWFLNIF